MEEPRKSYKKNPGSGTEGYLNQLRLSTLYFSRLAATGKPFEIGVEVATAGKFDDIVMYLVNEQQYCLVQAKHKQDETKRIVLDDLLKSTAEYSLPKYFESFLGLKNHILYHNGRLKYIVIYTNLKVDDNVMKVIEPVVDKDNTFVEILNVPCVGKVPSLYRFNMNCIDFIEQLIDRISPICEVARKLAEQLVQRKKISINPNGIFYEFHSLLVRDVFDLDRQLFREEFLANERGISIYVQKFRFLLERTLRSILRMENFSIANLNQFIQTGKLKLLFEPGFLNKLVTQSTKPDRDWIDYRVKQTDVLEFFHHLILAVDQPNFIELEVITKAEVLGCKESTDEYMRTVFDHVDRWIRDGEGVFLNANDWKLMCTASRARITWKKWLLKSEEYQKSNPAAEYFFDKNTLLDPLLNFLNANLQDAIGILSVYHCEVGAARVLQALNTLQTQFIVFEANQLKNADDIESCIPFIENLSNKVLVIICGDKCDSHALRNIRYTFNVLKSIKKIFITKSKHHLECVECISFQHNDQFELGEMSRQSQQKLLEKKITIQNRYVHLYELLAEDVASEFLNMEFISQLLMDQVEPIVYDLKYQCQLKGQYFYRTLCFENNVMDEDEFSRFLQNNCAVILSDVPGMGKTTFFEHFIERLSIALPDHLICLIHLKFYTETLAAITKLNAHNLSVNDAIWHATKCFFAGSSRFGQELFRNAILNTGKLIVLVDGYDSVIHRYKISVQRALQLFLQHPYRMKNLLIATRPHETAHLRDALPQAKIVSMRPFHEQQCVKFVSRCWKSDNNLAAIHYLQYLRTTYSDWVVGNPFQLKLLAEIYQENRSVVLNFGNLLEIYLEKQFHESNQRAIQVMGISQQRMAAETLKQASHEDHCDLAAQLLFAPTEPVNMSKFSYLLDIGLIILEGNQLRFEHRVFQDYYAAESLMTSKATQLDDNRLRIILYDPRNRYLLKFLMYHLGKAKNKNHIERFHSLLHI